MLSKCVVCDSKKSNFIREQEGSGSLSSLRIKTPLNKIHLVVSLSCFKNIKKLIQGIN